MTKGCPSAVYAVSMRIFKVALMVLLLLVVVRGGIALTVPDLGFCVEVLLL